MHSAPTAGTAGSRFWMAASISAHQALGKGEHAAMAKPGAVWAIDTASDAVVSKVPVGLHPAHVVQSPDGLDLQTFKVTRTVETGAGAHGVAIDREGRYAYITNTYADSVSVLDIKDGKLVTTVRVGKGPNGISVRP